MPSRKQTPRCSKHDWTHDSTHATRTGRVETVLRCRHCGKRTTAARLEWSARGQATQRTTRAIRERELVEAAAEATERFSEDELEAFAAQRAAVDLLVTRCVLCGSETHTYADHPEPAFVIEDHLSLALLQPLSAAAQTWIDEHLPSDRLTHGTAVVIEPRYVADIVAGIIADGFEVRRG